MKRNHEYVKDSSLETAGEFGADLVPLRGLVEGLHYCEVQTQPIVGNAFSLVLISDSVEFVHSVSLYLSLYLSLTCAPVHNRWNAYLHVKHCSQPRC